MPIDRRDFLKVAASTPLLAAPALRGTRSSLSTQSRPNVLFILTDEWRGQATGYAGDPNTPTRALNGLAAQSLNFTNYISNHPVCSPAKSSIITGQFPLTHGVFLNDEPLKPKGTTLGEAFAKAGYHTGWIGKWHMYGSPLGHYERRLAFIPPDRRYGFQYWKAAECDHNYNHSIYYEGDDPTPHYWPGYDAIAQSKDASQFIERQAKTNTPFFLVLSMGPPHFPLNTAPAKYQARYKNRTIQLRPNLPEGDRALATRDFQGYYAHIAAVDDCIAGLLETLERTNLSENTIVVFTADHGDMLYSQGLRSDTKHVPWIESAHPPFLLRYPKKFGGVGRVMRTRMGTPDIMPTLLGLADLPIPDGVEGVDWSKMCTGATPAPKDSVAFMQFPVAYGAELAADFDAYRGIITEHYTYVRTRHSPWILYDDVADPYQMHNLVRDPGSRDLLASMEALLQQHLKIRKDAFLPGTEYVKMFGYEKNREIASNARRRGFGRAPARRPPTPPASAKPK